MGSLSNLYISQSYQSLIHLGTNNTASANLIGLEDGLGNSIGVAVNTAGDISLSGSFTASLQNGYVWVGNSNGRTTTVPTSSFGGGTTINTGSFVTTSSFNAYTQSNDQRVSSLEINSSSVNISINALNIFTASQSTASIVTSITNLNQFTESANVRLNNLETTSASVNISISNLNSTTSSFATSIANLNSATASLFNSASLGLVTASLSGQTLTFTKGNGSTFDIIIPDVSGSDISALNAFTASQLQINSGYNTFTQSIQSEVDSLQAATSSYAISASVAAVDAAQQAQINALINATSSYADSASFAASQLVQDGRLNNLESTSASVNISIENINLFTQSADQRLDSIEAQSGSWVTSAITASSIITASVVDDDITFTKGDGSQFTIQISTGSFAISSSYAENAGTASIARNVIVNAKNGNPSTLNAGTVVRISSATGNVPIFNTASFDAEQYSSNTLGILNQTVAFNDFADVVVIGIVTGVNTDPALGYAAGDVIYLSSSGQFTKVQPQAPNQIVTLGEVLRVQQNNGSIFVNVSNGWELNELHNVQINNPQTGDLIQYESASYGLWKNKSISAAGITTTSSFNAYTSSTDNRLNNLEINSASVNVSISNLNLATQSLQSQLTTIGGLTGSYATTGSNNFTGSENISGSLSLIGPFVMSDITNGNASSLVTRSGSIVFVGSGFTSGSSDLAHISSSGNFVNFFMKNNNNTADTIISGSGNIFVNPAAPTAGFKRFMTGGNIAVGGTGAGVPQISGSMAWSPVIANNIFANSSTPITFRGPVSSSQSLLNNNIFAQGTLTLGPSTAATFERAINGTTFTGNILNGTVTEVAHKTAFISSSAMSMTGNMIGGTLNVLADSSSVSIANNTLQSTLTIFNSYYNASATGSGNAFGVSGGNGIFGSNHTIYVSGSNTTNGFGRQFISNFVAGNLISASVNLNGNNSNIIATSILGHGLSVTGSSTVIQSAVPFKDSTFGSVFVGRHNAQDGNRARTAETVFAVGTGTSTTNKTGFLIDSGSNTYIEGTLNVSGSTSMTGSLTLQTGSVTMPGRSAFRVSGSASTDRTAPLTLSGSATLVDYNQGGNYDNTTGVYTAPVAGLYNVYFNGRVGSANSQMQAIVYKNNTTSILMWEAPGLGASTHFGVSTIVYLAANDTLRANVTVGSIQFDANDNWGATYIG